MIGNHIQFFREAGSQLAIGLACIAGAGYWLLAPQAARWQQETAECLAIEAEKADSLHVAAVNDRIHTIAQRVEEIDQKNLASSDSAELYDAILRCSREAGVDLGRISPGMNQDQADGPSLFSVHVNATGEYNRIVSFFSKLHNLSAFHQVRQWRIESRESASGDHLATADIEIQFAGIHVPNRIKEILGKAVQP